MVNLEGYEIFAELKRGPWVAIYKAFEARRQRTVLVKMLLHADAPAAVQAQLGVESDLRLYLSHPNLRAVYDSGRAADRAFLVLEYVEGPTLAELITPHLPIELCAWIAKEVAKALAAIHRYGLLHRDVKPQNIFISQNGEVKLGDFGLAVDCSEVGANLAGTPAYFSPELILGHSPSARSDLFSLGAVLYEMLTASPPFADHTTPAILHRIANLEPLPPEKLRPEIPGELATLCRKLLSKNPEQRCRDADEITAELTRFEQKYQLKLAPQKLAQFLHQPETYVRTEFSAHTAPASPPSSSPRLNAERFAPLAAKRRFVPMLFAALLVCGFILMNFENKATKNSPVAPAARIQLPRARIESESVATLALKAKLRAAHPTKEILPEKIAPLAPASQNRMRSAPEPHVNHAATLSDLVMKEKLHTPSVLLLSEPRARVFVENDSLGLTPVRWTPARADQVYEVRFVSPTLPQVNKLIAAAILETDTLALNLWKEFAYLEIAVYPWGEIWMDGKPVDTTPLAAPLTLTPGLHELDIRHPQLGIRSSRLILTKGDTLRKVVNLLAPVP